MVGKNTIRQEKGAEIEASGYIETYINTQESFSFDLGDGLVLRFPVDNTGNIKKKFEIRGSVTNTADIEQKCKRKMELFLDKFSHFFNVPSKVLLFDRFVVKKDPSNPKGHASCERGFHITGAIAVGQDEIQLFDKTRVNYDIKHKIALHFYRCCLSEDNILGFMYVYLILQLLAPCENKQECDRKDIENYLKKQKTLKILQHDPYNGHDDGEDMTIITAIRDSISHIEAKFSGKRLNIEQEVTENIYLFRNIARELIEDNLQK
jgi:hypothetical protein